MSDQVPAQSPTWSADMEVLIASLEGGAELGRESSRAELRRVAKLLDTRSTADHARNTAVSTLRMVLDLIGNDDHTKGNGPNYAAMRGSMLNDIRSAAQGALGLSPDTVPLKENDTAEARLDMVRVVLNAILAGGSAVPLAKAGLDFCNLTQAQREEMRGEAIELLAGALQP